MENDFFNTSSSLTNHNYMASMDGFNSHIFSSSMFQSDITADHGNSRQIMHTDPSTYLTYQEEEYPSNCLYGENTLLHSTNAAFNLRQNLMGASLTATSLADLLSTTTSLRENHTTLNNEFSMNQLPSTQTSSTVHPSYLVGSSEEGWMSGRSALSIDYSQGNELSLSLGSSKPSVFGVPNAAVDHCPEVSFAGMRQIMSRGGGSKNAEEMHCLTRAYGDLFPNREKISLCCGSRYLLLAVQEILLELSSYATEDMEEVDDSVVDTVTEAKMASLRCSMVNGFATAGSNGLRFFSGENDYENYADLQQQEQSGARKCELMNLLQMVDQRFGHCADQIQNAASPFQSVTASGCQLPAQLALSTISNFYRNIRRKITHQIASFAQEPNFDFMKEKERSFESSFIQRQWALQQLKRSEHPSWRPQRGLPEKSVSVLRAWMFQNFLHPYPKDNDKQLLALKSGLTRNQVSNWFINARVRLWKPMIEEMYAEINRKNRAEEGSSSIRRCHS